uniref:Ribosomal protein eL8/eL30/eS12/Gadd45 domain-containing protein n=1 Tax=Salix viminalis TaxID=40686 RepID=A0A6N2LHT9_SALVM
MTLKQRSSEAFCQDICKIILIVAEIKHKTHDNAAASSLPNYSSPVLAQLQSLKELKGGKVEDVIAQPRSEEAPAPAPAETPAQPLEAMDLSPLLMVDLLGASMKMDCNQADYIKLAKALCADHGVGLLTVPSAKTLGEWVGLCNIDSKGKEGESWTEELRVLVEELRNRVERGAEDEDEKSDDEYLAEANEEESDLDLAWKMLDVAIAVTRIFCYLRSSGFKLRKRRRLCCNNSYHLFRITLRLSLP